MNITDNPKEELTIKLTNLIAPFIPNTEITDYKLKISLMLSDYEIEERHTELAIITEGKNEAVLKKFLASKIASGLSPRTIQFYRLTLLAFFGKTNKDFDEITADDIRLYLAIRTNRDMVSKVTANNERRNISAFYAWLQNEEILLKNPIKKVDPIKCKKEKKKAYSDMDMEKIRNSCKNNREKAIIEVLASTWCRVSELAQIKVSDIDNNEILVHGKGDKDRLVYLNAKAQLAVETYLNERTDNNPYLFARMKNPGHIDQLAKGQARKTIANWYINPDNVDATGCIDKGTIESIVRKIGKRAGVEDTHPHRFRRTGATAALRAGMPLITVSKMLGHSNIGVTQIYLDISDDELEEAHKKYVR